MAEYDLNAETIHWLFEDGKGPSGRYLSDLGDDVAGAMVALVLGSPATGRIYTTWTYTPGYHQRRSTTKKPVSDKDRPFPHEASSAGEPPANWTGDLVESIYVTDPHQTRSGRGRWSGNTIEVVVDSDYAELLEEGTFNIAPRPFMKRALDSVIWSA